MVGIQIAGSDFLDIEQHEMMLDGCNAVAAMDGKATYPSGRARRQW